MTREVQRREWPSYFSTSRSLPVTAFVALGLGARFGQLKPGSPPVVLVDFPQKK